MQTRLEGCWSGVRRGAKFGAFAGVMIWTVIMIVMLAITLVVPDLREHGLADLEKDWNHYGSLWAPLRMIGTLIAGFGLMAMYGVGAGVLVMGIVGFLRPRETEPMMAASDQGSAAD